jgi:Ca2+-binding EF-hand superfamily protein
MVDSTKLSDIFRSWGGIDKSLISGEFSAALKALDASKDGKLSKDEFSALTAQLGLSTAEAKSFFENSAGTASEVSISGLLSKAQSINTKEGGWTEADFKNFLTTQTKTSESIFRNLSGADAAMQRSELLATTTNSDANKDGKISQSEFESLAKSLGVDTSNLKTASEAFSDIAGKDKSAAVNDVMAYFSAFANTGNTYNEAAFTNIVNSLGGANPAQNPLATEDGSSKTADSGLTKAAETGTSKAPETDTPKTRSAAARMGDDSVAAMAAAKEQTRTPAGAAPEKTGSAQPGMPEKPETKTADGASSKCKADNDAPPAKKPADEPEKTPSTNTTFKGIAGADEIVQRTETSAALAAADKNTDEKLTKEEFRAFATELGVGKKADKNINTVFDLISNGEKSITTDQALAYLSAFNGANAEWDEGEYDSIVTRLEAGPVQSFDTLAKNDVITTAAISSLFTDSDADANAKLNRNEFNSLAARLGLPPVDATRFATLASSDKNISLAELTGFANPFGTTKSGTTTWTEAQFNAVLESIRLNDKTNPKD